MAFSSESPLPLPARFATIKKKLIAGKEEEITQSWKRLLARLESEVRAIESSGADIIPSIDFNEIQNNNIQSIDGRNSPRVEEFTSKLRSRGVAVIRGVVPKDTAQQWSDETDSYLADSPDMAKPPMNDPRLCQVYWSPAQVKARAYSPVLTTQKFLMSVAWRARAQLDASVTTNYPVVYADRLRIWDSRYDPCDESETHEPRSAHIDGGSVERWEPDGYGTSSTYQKIWDGDWENYDPWDSSTRLRVTSDLYNGAGSCSMFRMFQGWLSLGTFPREQGTLFLLPMLQLSTAYVLLRPFFSPIHDSASHPNFLSPDNWRLESPASSIIQGAVPSYTQELTAALHPHLQLARSMIRVPALDPGDYLVWHCDSVYALDNTPGTGSDIDTTILYLPACPLTQTNALYLARQRKAFLLGQPGPDFAVQSMNRGESIHMARPGVQEVSDTGGDDGLRAAGLLPWDDDDAETDVEAEVLEMANNILFPDRYELDMGY
jgi:hypothetical protein